jgi:hypothetical protein
MTRKVKAAKRSEGGRAVQGGRAAAQIVASKPVPEVRTDGRTFVAFDGMSWPLPPLDLGDKLTGYTGVGLPVLLEAKEAHRLRAVVAAYHQMIRDPETKRRTVIRALRFGLDALARASRTEGGRP